MDKESLKTDEKLIFPELSYKLVGIMFDVYNALGSGLKEKTYENATRKALEEEDLSYKQQLFVPVKYKDELVSKLFLDFLVEDKIVVELKVGDRFNKGNIDQIYGYLKSTNLKLGILVNFGSKDVKFKRILNVQ